MIDLQHIPEQEKRESWFLLIEPLAKARSLRPHSENSPLLTTLISQDGLRTWKDIKLSVEIALKNVKNAESIFSRASHIKTDADPDGVIDDMFAELRTVQYLIYKGFKKIKYNRREGLDFFGEFEDKVYNIEVAYIRGPSFKTQEQVYIYKTKEAPIFHLLAKNLINRLKSICDKKEKQVIKHGGSISNSLIFVLSDLFELHEPLLNHDKFQGKHPILGFVVSRKIPTIVFSPGTIYEPDASSLNGVFGKLKAFDWLDFSNQKF